jgi:hypothetical protein
VGLTTGFVKTLREMSATKPRAVLIGNYPPDQQQSMLRLAQLFARVLESCGCEVELIQPREVFGRLARFLPRLAKWIGYVDKYVVFPFELRRRAKQAGSGVVYHIVDHSNAVYAGGLAGRPLVCTCNDVLAIRSGLGEIPQNPTRFTGRILQRWILAGLRRVPRIVCISENTRRELTRVLGPSDSKLSAVHLPLNFDFAPLPREEAAGLIEGCSGAGKDLVSGEFLLHVGGNQWYKNRMGVCQIYKTLAGRWTAAGRKCPPMVLVGHPPGEELREFVRGNSSLDIRFVTGASNRDVAAFYSSASVLLFPSLQEGFGWPILEAMACGCPVVTTGRAPMTEVGGDAAIYISPENVEESATAVEDVLSWNPEERAARVRVGLANLRRFSERDFVEHYLEAYREAAALVRSAA